MDRTARLMATGSFALLATACDEPPPAETDITSPADAQMGPGLYAVGDGTTVYSRKRLNGDGAYLDLNEAGETVGGGSWFLRDEAVCFDPEGDGPDQEVRCWRNDPPDADGSFTTRRIDSPESYRVTPIEARLAED